MSPKKYRYRSSGDLEALVKKLSDTEASQLLFQVRVDEVLNEIEETDPTELLLQYTSRKRKKETTKPIMFRRAYFLEKIGPFMNEWDISKFSVAQQEKIMNLLGNNDVKDENIRRNSLLHALRTSYSRLFVPSKSSSSSQPSSSIVSQQPGSSSSPQLPSLSDEDIEHLMRILANTKQK